MIWNYIVYALIVLGIVLRIIYKTKTKKIENPENLFHSLMIEYLNYSIALNIIISIIAVVLKLNQIIDFEQYIFAMYISFIIIVLSSLLGIGEAVNRLISLSKKSKESLTEVSSFDRISFFLRFAMFVFGASWALSDSLMTFTWLDFFSKLISIEEIQHTPMIGILYLVSIYLNFIYQSLRIIPIKRISLIRSK